MVIDGFDVSEGNAEQVDHIAALLRRVAVGDRAAFTQLYDLMSARMFGLIRRVLVDRDQSEEVLQDVFLEVWRTADHFDPTRGQGRSWLLTITHRRAVDRVRAARASVARDLRIGMRDLDVSFDGVAEHIELAIDAQAMTEALSRLPEKQREALVLAYFGGYHQSEIAALTGVPLGTIKTRMRDGLTKLRAEMGVNA
jgi:RNA polymerase sigma-70 factor (ECF subfamily)